MLKYGMLFNTHQNSNIVSNS